MRAQAIDSLTALTHSKPQGFGEQADRRVRHRAFAGQQRVRGSWRGGPRLLRGERRRVPGYSPALLGLHLRRTGRVGKVWRGLHGGLLRQVVRQVPPRPSPGCLRGGCVRLPAARRISRLEGVPKLDQKQDFRENKACHEIIHSFQQIYFFSSQRKGTRQQHRRARDTN